MAKRVARLIPYYEYDEAGFFSSDGAPEEVAQRRRDGFAALAALYRQRFARTAALASEAAELISDLQFTGSYRVPFQYSRYVRQHLKGTGFLQASAGVLVTDLDGNDFHDLTGSYGANVFGYDFYKHCIAEGSARVHALGPVLGAYHPLVADNARRLRAISGLDEVSFHMSGTEAVMQPVRLARYHTRRSHLVRFCGAYHGWWEDVQPGIGNPLPPRQTYTLREMAADSLHVLATRKDIACVLVNPLQALHPNTGAPGGAQEYFGVRTDMVTYGKTLGGGLPVGVVCGRRDLMKRFRDERPADICFARGTFNSHPYVMGAMQVFLEQLERSDVRALGAGLDERWNGRAAELNRRLTAAAVPVQVANLSFIWTVVYTRPGRYNWLLQYYLDAEGLALSWVGSGRLIFGLNYSSVDFDSVAERFVAAARAMARDGWWWEAPGLTNQAIRRRILRELISHRLGYRR